MYVWTPPRGYEGQRTQYRQAIKVAITNYPKDSWGRDIRNAKNCAMEAWCEKFCTRHWSHVDGYFWFDKTTEAVLFKLTFGGSHEGLYDEDDE